MSTITPIQPSKLKPNGPKFVVRHGSGPDRHEPTFHSKEGANAYLNGVRESTGAKRPDPGLYSLAERYLARATKGLAASTVAGKTRRCALVCEMLEDVPIRSIDVDRIIRFRKDLEEKSFNLRAPTYYVLRGILDLAVLRKILSTNPCDELPPPDLPDNMSLLVELRETEIAIPSEDLFLRLIEFDRSGPSRDIIMLALLGGLRIGEMIALAWSKVLWGDGEFGELDIVTAHSERDEHGNVKTWFSNRRVPMVEMLRDHLFELAGGSYRDDEGLVILQEGGLPMTHWTARSLVKHFQVEAGIGSRIKLRKDGHTKYEFEGVSGLHGLRHACAAFWIWEGADDIDISQWLGHLDPVFTMDTYGYLMAAHQNGAKTWPTIFQTTKGKHNA